VTTVPPRVGFATALAVVLVFVLRFSPYAHADTSASGLTDPFTDVVRLWSAALFSLDSLAHQLA
jgi:hypothetical protein